mgnify:CR=1 FL=1
MALGPFIEQQRRDLHIYNHIEEVVPKRDKETRAGSIRGMTEIKKVLFPHFASWWEAAEHELLTFPGGKHDDFVDFLGLLGAYVHNMQRTEVLSTPLPEWNSAQTMTFGWLKKSARRHALAGRPRYCDR